MFLRSYHAKSIGVFSLLMMLIAPSLLFAQTNVVNGGGAGTVSTATTGVAFGGLDGTYSNAAAIADVSDRFGFDLGVKQRFELEELNIVSFASYYKMSSGSIGLQLTRYGFDQFNEQRVAVNYARKLSRGFNAGISLNAITVSIAEFGSKTAATFDIGLSSKINRTLTLASSIQNITSTAFTDNLNIPVRLMVGARYKPNKKVNVALEFEKSIDTDFTIKSALLYNVTPDLQLRTGIDIFREEFGLGVSYSFGNFRAIGAYSFDTLLGNTPGFTARYNK